MTTFFAIGTGVGSLMIISVIIVYVWHRTIGYGGLFLIIFGFLLCSLFVLSNFEINFSRDVGIQIKLITLKDLRTNFKAETARLDAEIQSVQSRSAPIESAAQALTC